MTNGKGKNWRYENNTPNPLDFARYLTREAPLTVTRRAYGYQVILTKECGFKEGDKLYEIYRDDGVLELIPEEIFDPETRDVRKDRLPPTW